MKFFSRTRARTNDLPKEPARLVFASTTALEQSLDGTESAFNKYFFALYQSGPDEDCELVKLRTQLKAEYPQDVVLVGDRFVLWGHSAFKVVSSYYFALASQADTEEFRKYCKNRYEEVVARHKASQALPIPIGLSEGQLSADQNLEFYACTAIANGQVFPRETK